MAGNGCQHLNIHVEDKEFLVFVRLQVLWKDHKHSVWQVSDQRRQHLIGDRIVNDVPQIAIS